MAKQTSIALAVGCGGDGISQYTYIPPQSPLLNNAAPEAAPVAITLGAGATTITPPAGATRLLIVPILNSVNPKTVKTTIGDAGLAFTGDLVMFPLGAATAVYFTATAAEVVYGVWG